MQLTSFSALKAFQICQIITIQIQTWSQYNQLFRIVTMFFVVKITRLFSKNLRVWSEAQPLFKDYYSRRLTLTPHQLQNFMIRLSGKQFSEADHRWISLLQNIEAVIYKYQLNARVYMLKALAGMNSKTELVLKLKQSILSEVGSLTFEEAAIILWCLSKISSARMVEEVTRVYKHICEILTAYEDQDGYVRIVICKNESREMQQRVLALKSTSICMILTAMSNLAISERTILKHLLKSAIKPNVAAFSINGLVTLLVSIDKLQLRNRRESLLIYAQIRKRYTELQLGPLETIENLAWAVANLTVSKHFDENQRDQKQKSESNMEKMIGIHQELKKFLLWLCETIIIRQKILKKQKAAKILHYCGKAQSFNLQIWSKALNVLCLNIEECKIIDLVMAIKALTKLKTSDRQKLNKQEEIICGRLWILHSSIAGKSLQILINLFALKKIRPPPRIAQQFVEITMKRQIHRKVQGIDKTEEVQK